MNESFLGVNPWTALFILLNTLTVFFVARKFLFAPVMKIIRERQEEIDGMYEKAEAAQIQAQAMEAEYTRRLENARADSDTIVRDAVARGQSREEEILENANREAQAILAKAEADIAREKKKAINDAKDEISGLALTIAEKVVERELNARDQSQLIDRFLEELGEGL